MTKQEINCEDCEYYNPETKDCGLTESEKADCCPKTHIHKWNSYKEGKLCCSVCGMFYNQYLTTKPTKEEAFKKAFSILNLGFNADHEDNKLIRIALKTAQDHKL